VTNITFEILGNAFYSGARIGSIDFEDLWFIFHQMWLDMNLLVIFCLYVYSCSFNLLNTLLIFTVLIHFLGMISCYVGCNSWTMCNWEDNSKIGILDPTRVNQVSHTVNLRKELEMYNGMTMKQFNKEVADMSKSARTRVSLYIAKAMHVFVKGGKTTINISYFLK
jgi:hypothetical protein